MATNQLTANFTHTYNGKEFVEQLFFQPQLEGKDLYGEFQFIPDLKTKVNIYLPRRLQKILRADTGCGRTAVGTTTINDKTITPCKIRVDLEECEDQWDNTVFEDFLKPGVDRNDLTDTVIGDVMEEQTNRAIREDNQKLLWFGSDSDPDTFYGICDGFWRLLIDASSSIGHSIDMSNDSNIEDGAGVLVQDGALEALKQIWANQPATLRKMAKDAKFYVTATIWDNLTETYEALGTDSGLARLEDGSATLGFRGRPVVDMCEWDDALADSANPFQAEIGDNAILYTIPKNLVIGADVSDPNAQIRIWFDPDDELVKTRAKWKQAVQFVEEELICIAI